MLKKIYYWVDVCHLEQIINKIGFFINSPFHYYLYENTINKLLEKGYECDLIINDYLLYDPEWKNMYDSNVEFIEGINREDIEAYPCSLLVMNKIRYVCLVSPYYFDQLSTISVYNIRMVYGAGYGLEKESFNFSYWNTFYDTILNYGKYDYERTNIFNSGVIVGNPKFDKWFNNEFDVKSIKDELKIDPSKKTILYAPTYGVHSSIDEWKEQLIQINKEYNIIVKLHHGTAHLSSESIRKDKILSNFNIVRDDKTNTLELFKVSDLVISDTSGLIYDALLAEKKIVILNTNKSNRYRDLNNEAKLLRKVVPSWEKECNIHENVQNILNESPSKNPDIESLLGDLFAFKDGLSSKRAADAIIQTFENPKRNQYREDLKRMLKL